MDKSHTSAWKPASQGDKAIQSADRYTSKQLLTVFWPYLEPHRARIALAILALLLVAGA